MSKQFCIILEHDGDNPIRNDFVCKIDDLYYSYLREWEDLYANELGKCSSKKHSLKTKEYTEGYLCYSWDINKIIPQIEIIKKEMELDTDLDESGKELLNKVILDLQRLYDCSMGKCRQYNTNPDKCYLLWWIDY